jgi:hypothetical protein
MLELEMVVVRKLVVALKIFKPVQVLSAERETPPPQPVQVPVTVKLVTVVVARVEVCETLNVPPTSRLNCGLLLLIPTYWLG